MLMPTSKVNQLISSPSSFYDSVYTERYMLTPEANPSGYAASGIVRLMSSCLSGAIFAERAPHLRRTT